MQTNASSTLKRHRISHVIKKPLEGATNGQTDGWTDSRRSSNFKFEMRPKTNNGDNNNESHIKTEKTKNQFNNNNNNSKRLLMLFLLLLLIQRHCLTFVRMKVKVKVGRNFVRACCGNNIGEDKQTSRQQQQCWPSR